MDNSTQAVAIFDKYASEYMDKYMDVGNYAEGLDLFCEEVPKPNPEILEIACGPGNTSRYVLGKIPDAHLLGIDLAERMLILAKNNNPSAEFACMDCRNIRSLAKKYDGVICGFCLPYLNKNEAVQLLHDAADLLNSNGVLYLSTMEDDYENSRFQTSSKGDQLFMHYHEAGYLKAALQSKGIATIYEHRLPQTGELVGTPPDLVLVARKQSID